MNTLSLQHPGSHQFNFVSPDAIIAAAFEAPRLRPHQQSAIDMLRASLRAGKKRPLIMAPTGYGKTVVAGNIVSSALAKGKRVIFTVPSISLIDQTLSSFFRAGIYDVGVMQGDHPQTDPSAPVQIASIQTLCRRKIPQADLVLIDEAHKVFDSYAKWMAMPEWKNVPFVGLSATPWTKGLGKIFDDLIIAETTQGLIDSGYLAPFRAFAPASHIKPDLSKVHTKMGDFDEAELSAEMQKSPLIADTVRTWLEKGEGRPTIVFAVDRAHAGKLHDQFQKAGVAAEYVDAFTAREERGAIGRRLEEGKAQVVVNIGCLTTGVDWPFVSCIVLARPTKSEMLYVQCVGRGLRTHPGKQDLILLDHSDTTVRLGFVTDIHHGTLDDGSVKRAKPKKGEAGERGTPLPRECDHCGYLKPAGVRKCKCCGWEPKRQSDIKNADGELVAMNGKAIKADQATKQAWYSMLLRAVDERGQKEGRAFHLYQEKFGVQPSNKFNRVRLQPTQEVRNFVRSRDIAWAKSRHAA